MAKPHPAAKRHTRFDELWRSVGKTSPKPTWEFSASRTYASVIGDRGVPHSLLDVDVAVLE